MKTYTLTRIHDPFNRSEKDVIHLAYLGEPLSVIRERHLPPDVGFVVSIGGRVIPEERLPEVIPQPGDYVTCLPVLAGGNDGKMIGRIIGMIVLAAVAWYAAPLIFGGAAGAAGWAAAGAAGAAWSTGYVMAAMAAMTVAGGMVVNAILPAARPSIPSIGMDYGKSQLYGWNPQTIQQQGGAIGEWFGRNKLYGNIISSFIEMDGDQQYLNVLISLGYGPFSDIPISTMRINDQPIANFNGVTTEVRLGHLNQDVIARFYTTLIETPLSRKVTNTAAVVYTTDNDDFDALEIELSCPQGLYSINGSGGYDAVTVEARVEISLHSADDWRNISQTAESYDLEVLQRWSAGYWISSNKNIYNPVSGASLPIQVKIWWEIEAGENNYSQVIYHPSGVDDWWEDVPYHNNGDALTGHPEAQWHWFDGTAAINVVQATDNHLDITGNGVKPLRRIARASSLVHGRYDIRITRISDDSNDMRIQTDLYLSKVSTATPDAQEYPREVLVAVRALGTDQLSGSLRYSVIADCKLVRVYSGGNWSVRFSKNNAWVMWHIFTRPVFANDLSVVRYDGYDPSKMDLAKFAELATRCDTQVPDGIGGTEPLFEFNGGFDSDGNVWTAAMQVAEECGAVPFWNGFKITLAIDQPAVPESGFGMGNINEGSYEETWLPIADRATEVEVTFRDAAQDYKQTPYTVMNPDTPAVTPNKTQRQAVGITSGSGAWRYGLHKIRANEVLLCTIKFSIDVESIACTLGDCVHFSNDWPQWGFSGRVVSATENTVTLDRNMVVEDGVNYQVMVIHSDNTSSTRSVTNIPGTYNTLSLATPYTLLPALYEQYFFGETELIAKPFIISRMEPSGDLQATIYGVEYNPTLEGAYTDTPVVLNPDYSALIPLPPVTGLIATEMLTKRQDGTIDTVVIVNFIVPPGPFKTAEIWVSADGARSTRLGESPNGSYQFAATENVNYTIAALTKNTAGEKMALANSPRVNIRPRGKNIPPANVTSFTIHGTTINWTPVTDVDLAGYEVRYHVGQRVSYGDGIPMHTGLLTASPHTLQIVPAGQITIMICARDSSGNYSLSPAVIVTDFGDPITNNVIVTKNFKELGWPAQNTLMWDPNPEVLMWGPSDDALMWDSQLVNGTVVDGNLVADDASDLMWNPDENTTMWGFDGDLMWPDSNYHDMQYEFSAAFDNSVLGGRLLVNFTAAGNKIALYYRPQGPNLMWSYQPDDPMWTDDYALMWSVPDFMPWPGEIPVTADIYDFRISTGFGPVQGVISELQIIVDVPDIRETLTDVVIAAGGTRLPITKTYRVIKAVNLTKQYDGGTSRTVEVIDKDPAGGPLVKGFDSSYISCGALVDANIEGY